MKKIASGDVSVLATSPRNWDEQFAQFERDEPTADYMVSWIDCFGRGEEAGRGQYHGAWHVGGTGDFSASLRPEYQDLPDTIMGLVPKSLVWRVLKLFCNQKGHALHQLGQGPSGPGSGRPQGTPLGRRRVFLSFSTTSPTGATPTSRTASSSTRASFPRSAPAKSSPARSRCSKRRGSSPIWAY